MSASTEITAALAERIETNADGFRRVEITDGGDTVGWRFDGGYAGNYVSPGNKPKHWKRISLKKDGDETIRVYSKRHGQVAIREDLVLYDVPQYVKVVSKEKRGEPTEIVAIYWESEGGEKETHHVLGIGDSYDREFEWKLAVGFPSG